MPGPNAIMGFEYEVTSSDACRQLHTYSVLKKKKVERVTSSAWLPQAPRGSASHSTLKIIRASGKIQEIDLDGIEHDILMERNGLAKMMEKIVLGQTPGQTLGKILSKIADKMPTLDGRQISQKSLSGSVPQTHAPVRAKMR